MLLIQAILCWLNYGISLIAEYPGYGPGQVEQSAPGLTQVCSTSGSSSVSGIPLGFESCFLSVVLCATKARQATVRETGYIELSWTKYLLGFRTICQSLIEWLGLNIEIFLDQDPGCPP